MSYYVYIMAKKYNTVLYTGMTNDLQRRVYEHKMKITPGFTSRYNVTKLVYFEEYEDINETIDREKQIKAGSRMKKNQLVESINSNWRDLYEDIVY